MATFDWLVLGLLGLSLLLGLWRGLVYSVLAVAGWIAAFLLAQWFAADAAALMPLGGAHGGVRYAVGFVAVFVAAAFASGLLASLVRRLVHAIGLSPADRVLGALFGLVRGIVLVLSLAMVVHLTGQTNARWWNESVAGGVADSALRGLRPAVPEPFGRYLPH